MLSEAERRTARRGFSARVAIDAAIALPVSWKPFVKSNAKAVATTVTSNTGSVTSPIVAYPKPRKCHRSDQQPSQAEMRYLANLGVAPQGAPLHIHIGGISPHDG
jgi:hypothetical protein